MKGFPKHINCAQDVQNLLALYPDQTKAAVQKMLDERQGWIMTGKLEAEEAGLTDDTHEVRDITDEAGNVTERYQYEYMDDPGCELFRIGLTVEQAQEVING